MDQERADDSLFVLIAEDDDDDIDLLKMILTQYFPDWHYHFVSNGQSALEFLKESYAQGQSVSFVLSDINMPIKDGITTLAELRASEEYKKIPVVAFSTTAFLPVVEKFMQLGGNAYFQKPTSLDEIVQVLHQIPELVSKPLNN